MIPALIERTDGRWTFVVGKGGVGKTTTAGALALALADAGRATHLLSTDPAHSLGDLFAQDLSDGRAHPSACTERLTLEEFDARAYADRWRARAAAPLTELMERGTYLEAPDIDSLFDLSLPGADELMAALRLADLQATKSIERFVVDTAPTGHTLRLLGADEVLRGWVESFRAMADKAGVVAYRLTRAPVRLAAEELLDQLEARLARLRDEVYASAAFVVVARPEPVVRAETERLARALRERGLRVTAEALVGGAAAPGAEVVPIPVDADARGCQGLRRLGTARPGPVPAATAPRETAFTTERTETTEETAAAETSAAGDEEIEPKEIGATEGSYPVQPSASSASSVVQKEDGAAGVLDRLAGYELLLFAGKGGVGKTTCAAAAALALAERRSVSLFSTDPAGSIGDVFGVDLPPEGARLGARLFARQIDAAVAFEDLLERHREAVEQALAGIGLDRGAELDRRVVESLWRLAPPGIDEIAALVAMMDAAGRQDTLVVDTAPTGHFLRLVEMPRLALDWTHALMRILLRYRSLGGLDEPADRLLRFARQLKDLMQMLADPARSAALVVTLEGPLVEAETARLCEALERAGVSVAAVIENRRAAAGARGSAPAVRSCGAVVLAPEAERPIVGERALRAFIAGWERPD